MFREITLGEARKLGLVEQILGLETWPDGEKIITNVPDHLEPQPVLEAQSDQDHAPEQVPSTPVEQVAEVVVLPEAVSLARPMASEVVSSPLMDTAAESLEESQQ